MRYNTNMFNGGYKLSRNTIIALFAALVVVIALIAMVRYLIVRDKRRAEQNPPRSISTAVSDEVLHSLTPPDGATSTPVSQAVLDSLTPPKNAASTAISQSVLDSLTPPTK